MLRAMQPPYTQEKCSEALSSRNCSKNRDPKLVPCEYFLPNTNMPNHTIQDTGILYDTMQYKILGYYTIQYNTRYYTRISYDAIQYKILRYYTIQYNITLWGFIPL